MKQKHELLELSNEEMLQVSGGANLPPITAVKTEIPKWINSKYGHTPLGSLIAARDIGYEGEPI